MNELRNRGVEDILITVVDGLKGFPEDVPRHDRVQLLQRIARLAQPVLPLLDIPETSLPCIARLLNRTRRVNQNDADAGRFFEASSCRNGSSTTTRFIRTARWDIVPCASSSTSIQTGRKFPKLKG
jgi:hypothetical protein